MNLLKSILTGFVLMSLTSLAVADGHRKHLTSRKPTIQRPAAGRTESVDKNESLMLRKRQDKATPLKQTGQQAKTSPTSLKPPSSTKPASGIIAILIGL
ncbi:MAG: hypothetical protein JNJ77_12445 [Planctomycetia bacterium]|nr:hypothetical protein [Planctomycetia bacterium]